MFSLKTRILAKHFRPDIDFDNLNAESLAWLKLIEAKTGGNPIRNATIENGIAYFDGVTVSQPLVSLKLNIPVTQTGSGTPSPDNIRDIVGVQGVTIGQTSGYGEYFKGLLNGTYGFVDLGSLSWATTTATPYRFNAELPLLKTQVTSVVGNLLTKDYTAVTYDDSGSMDKIICGYTAALGQKIRIQDTDYIDATAEQFKTAMQGKYLIYELAEPSTPVTPQEFATLCQAFGITGNTYTISFGQTVYAGTLDVLSGVLTVTHKYFSISYVEFYGTYGIDDANLYYCTIPDYYTEVIEKKGNKYENGNIISNIFSQTTGEGTPSMANNEVRTQSAGVPERFYFRADSFADVTAFNSYISNTPIQIVAKLAEPIEIQLTPTQITTLIGENVIFADVGDITECKYTRK